MNALLEAVGAVLLQQWLWDIQVFSQPWLYYWLLIPATVFFVFFLLKWAILTAPLWVPLALILGALRK